MRVWIVTGGIGSGKTEVCRILHRLGYVCQYDSDSRVKALYDRYPVLVERIENRLGCRLRDEKGCFVPSLLAGRIFSDRAALEMVENLVFPVLMQDFSEFASGAEVVIFESATILQKRYFDAFGDDVIYVDAPQQVRLERACKRDALPEEKVLSRMENQRLTQDECERISFRIDSDCSLEELEQRVRAVVRQLEDKQLIDN